MTSKLMNQASPVLMYVATFKRKAKRGTHMTGQQLRDEILQMFREQDQSAQTETGLADVWALCRKPLIYLVDEIMINTEWEHRGWWAEHNLENALLGSPQKMRGIRFYDDLEQARKKFEISNPADRNHAHFVDLLTVYYCCLRFGFEGKFAGQPHELERETQQLAAKLPLSSREQVRIYFAEAYQHTIEIPPNYETVMRLVTIVAIVMGMFILFIGFRQVLWNDLLNDLRSAVEQSGDLFANKT